MPAINLKSEQWCTIRDALQFMAREYRKTAEKHVYMPACGMLRECAADVEEIAALVKDRAGIASVTIESQ